MIRLSRRSLDLDPNLLWNSFVEFLGSVSDGQLSPTQRMAWFTFRYDSEVLNGGHVQFFANNPDWNEWPLFTALDEIGATAFMPVLRRAMEIWKRSGRQIGSAEELIAASLESETLDLDREYYQLTPTVIAYLEFYLQTHLDAFVEVVA